MKNKKRQIKEKLRELFYSEIQPAMLELDKQREVELTKLKGNIKKIIILTLLTYFIVSPIAWIYFKLSPWAFSILIVYLAVYIIVKRASANRNFKEKLKKTQLTTVLSAFQNVIKIKPTKKLLINKTELKMSGLFPTFFNILTDDTFNCSYNDVEFKIQECALTNGDINMFKGVIVKFQSNKKIKAQTIITSKKDLNIKNRDFGLFIAAIAYLIVGFFIYCPIVKHIYEEITIYGRGIDLDLLLLISIFSCIPISGIVFTIMAYKLLDKRKKVKLEDVSFDKRFYINSEDEIEARYLITPTFMDRLQNLQTAFGTRNIKCSFQDDAVILAIHTKKNLFEIGDLFQPLGTPEQMEEFFNELISILIMVDYFKLDEKTGL